MKMRLGLTLAWPGSNIILKTTDEGKVATQVNGKYHEVSLEDLLDPPASGVLGVR